MSCDIDMLNVSLYRTNRYGFQLFVAGRITWHGEKPIVLCHPLYTSL